MKKKILSVVLIVFVITISLLCFVACDDTSSSKSILEIVQDSSGTIYYHYNDSVMHIDYTEEYIFDVEGDYLVVKKPNSPTTEYIRLDNIDKIDVRNS